MVENTKTNIWEKIGTIDPRIFYVILILLMIIPLVRPLGISIPIDLTTQDFYDKVNSLEPGAVVLVHAGISPTSYPELGPGLKAFMEQALKKDIKILVWSNVAASVPMWEKLMSAIKVPSDKTYGDDWVYLGFIPGAETAIAGLAQDIWGTIPSDNYGTPLDQLPMMESIHNAEDISIYYDVTMGTDTLESALRQFNSPYGTPILLNTATGMIPATMPYYPDQVVGVLYGIRGGGEYETLVKVPWQGIAKTDVLSTVNLFIVIIMLLGNVSYFVSKSKSLGGSQQ